MATALFQLAQAGFLFYLDRIFKLEAVYGSLTSVLVLLLWLYLSASILIIGAEYNIVREEFPKPNPSSASPG